MDLFLSWSGERSRALAEAARKLLAGAYGDRKVRSHFSADIAKGEDWSDALGKSLKSSDAVLICLTPEAIQSTWITFEAGFIVGRSDRPRVFTLLYEVTPQQIPDPLRSYQSTSLGAADMQRLAVDMTGSAPVPKKWSEAWATFEEAVATIAPLQLDEIIPDIGEWFQRKTFDVPVHHCLDQSWIERYAGAIETRQRMRSEQKRVDAAGARFGSEVFRGLLSAVDSYAAAIRGLLLVEQPPFPTAEDGTIDFQTPGILEALEERRLRVKTLLNAGVALAPFAQPEAFRFERLETFAEKKDLIHRKRTELERDLVEGHLDAPTVDTWRTSEWDFDRITAYLVDALPGLKPEHDVIEAAEVELEKARAIDGRTLVPLHYSLKAVEAVTGRASSASATAVDDLLAAVARFLESLGDEDRTRGPDSVVERIRLREANRVQSEKERR